MGVLGKDPSFPCPQGVRSALGAPIVKRCNSWQKCIAMGAGCHSKTRKQRDFQVEVRFLKNGGLAPTGEKCEFSREKRDRYGFDPLKRPGFFLKCSQTVRIDAETMRFDAGNNRKPTTAEP
jgi:hypothetical protein